MAYTADIGSKPGRFNINGRWQAWQLNKNTLLTLTKPLFHRPEPFFFFFFPPLNFLHCGVLDENASDERHMRVSMETFMRGNDPRLLEAHNHQYN